MITEAILHISISDIYLIFVFYNENLNYFFGTTLAIITIPLMERRQNREGFFIKTNQILFIILRPDLYSQ